VRPELLEHLRRERVQSAAVIPIAIAHERTCVLALENRNIARGRRRS
jgi:hypothetical protein